ncbi:MAG: putative transporter, partial [Pseudonocardiales bacterium]|nr:putative transporter [Pseudonocardiales bacterium]
MAVATTFVAHGVLVGAWAPRIPEIKAHLGLSAGALGVALLAPALGTILAARVVGARTARHGSPAVVRLCSVAYCLLAWVPGVATNLGTLWLALLVWGVFMGAMDVSMNSQGVTVEADYGRPVLSSFHATWSIGSFVGAALGGAGSALHVNVAVQQLVVGVVLAIAVLVAGRGFLADHPPEPAPRVTRRLRVPRRPETRLVLLGVSAIFALIAEGAVVDWSGVLLRDHLHVRGGQVSFAYAAFCVTMTGGRFAGDRVVHAIGRAKCFTVLAIVGAAGLAAGMAADNLVGVVIGFAVLGFGLSIMVPVLFSTAADTDGPAGPAIAAVSALGCIGLLAGPSLIGLVAELTSVRSALYLLPPFTLAAGALGVLGIRMSRR